MADLDIRLTGSRDTVRGLERVERSLRGRLVEKALVAGALLVVNEAKRRAVYRTGNLRRSIHIGGHTDRTPLGAYTVKVSKKGKRSYRGTQGTDIGRPPQPTNGAAIKIGTNLAYARRIEYGFIGTDSRGRRYHQAARPFLRPALDAKRDAVSREVAKALGELVRAEFGRR